MTMYALNGPAEEEPPVLPPLAVVAPPMAVDAPPLAVMAPPLAVVAPQMAVVTPPSAVQPSESDDLVVAPATLGVPAVAALTPAQLAEANVNASTGLAT